MNIVNTIKNKIEGISIALFEDEFIRETLFSSNIKYYKFIRRFNLFFSFINIIPLIYSFINFNLPYFLGYLIFALGIYIIWIFELITNSIIFEEIKTFTIIQIALHSFFGLFLGFYDKYDIFDDILHLSGGIWLATIIFPLVLSLELTYSRQKMPSLILKVNFYTFSIGMTMGVIWEIFEFISDSIFSDFPGYRLAQEGSLTDTMMDLIYDSIGIIVGIFIFWKILKRLNKDRDMYVLLEKIGIALRKFVDKKNWI
ncbi:hypothetical protein JCM30566_19820 [Marinitoga arctica]